MKNKVKERFVRYREKKSKRMFLLLLFSFSFSFLASPQDFQYFIPDTMSADIVYFKLKGEKNWSTAMDVEWHWRNDSQLIKYTQENIFKIAFQDVNWKQVPALLKVGVFFRFDKTLHIDYVHFTIRIGSFSRDDLLRLETNFLEYAHMIKKIDLSPYVYTEDPLKFKYVIGRIWLIHEKSPVWNEK